MTHQPEPTPFLLSRRGALATLAGAAAQLAGCGGSTDVAGLSSGGTGSFTTGTVTGLGSLIVGDVRFDDVGAALLRVDGEPAGPVLPGMVVALQASQVRPGAAGGLRGTTAQRIRYGSEWLGPIEAVDGVAGRLTVLGQTVRLLANTVFDGAGVLQKLSELSVGQVVAVHGYLDVAAGSLLATRIELCLQPAFYRLSGVASGWNAGGRSLGLRGMPLRYRPGGELPGRWGSSMPVAMRLDTAQGLLSWEVVGLEARPSALDGLDIAPGSAVSLRGMLSAEPAGTEWQVDGLAVDVGQVSLPTGLGAGALLAVEGQMGAGVVRAREVRRLSLDELQAQRFVFFGDVSQLLVQAGGKGTFSLRGLSFECGQDTQLGLSGWITGMTPRVRVHAVPVDGQWQALEIDPA